tara:strand:- start:27 stop:833 length:807 start_codon:yes stop_codon:yes gene_type:complete
MLNLRQGSITTHFNMPKFCGSVDAGTQHSGSQTAVGLNCNGIWELKHTAHGVSGYYDDYWYAIYPWTNNSSFETKMFRKTSDNTWVMIQNNGTIRYTNPSKSSAPPTSGWVTTGGSGAAPVPQITFKEVVNEYSALSLTNCTLVDNSETDRITIRSDSSTDTKNIIFGTNTLNVGDKIAVGFKLETSGVGNNAPANFLLGGNTINASFPFDTFDEGTFKLHSFDQTVGKTHANIDYTPTSTGFTMQNYVNVFPVNASVTIKDLRVFVL